MSDNGLFIFKTKVSSQQHTVPAISEGRSIASCPCTELTHFDHFQLRHILQVRENDCPLKRRRPFLVGIRCGAQSVPTPVASERRY